MLLRLKTFEAEARLPLFSLETPLPSAIASLQNRNERTPKLRGRRHTTEIAFHSTSVASPWSAALQGPSRTLARLGGAW